MLVNKMITLKNRSIQLKNIDRGKHFFGSGSASKGNVGKITVRNFREYDLDGLHRPKKLKIRNLG